MAVYTAMCASLGLRTSMWPPSAQATHVACQEFPVYPRSQLLQQCWWRSRVLVVPYGLAIIDTGCTRLPP